MAIVDQSLYMLSVPAPWARLIVQGFQDVYTLPIVVPSNVKLPLWVAILESTAPVSVSATEKAKLLLQHDFGHTKDLPLEQQHVAGKSHCGSGCIIGFGELYRVYDDVPSVWYDGDPTSPSYDGDSSVRVYAWYFNKTRYLPKQRWIPVDDCQSPSTWAPLTSVNHVNLRRRIMDEFVGILHQ